MTDDRPGEVRLPLSEERLHVGKRQVETDRVRVRTRVDAQEMTVDGTLEEGVVDIRRVAVEREVDAAPPTRQEGDTVIVSLFEERLVVEKRLFVTEELHIRRVATAQPVSIPVTVRAMRADIERDDDPRTTGGA